MGAYRIVEWWPDQPDKEELAMMSTFHDLALAEMIKETLEEGLPERRFALELVKPDGLAE